MVERELEDLVRLTLVPGIGPLLSRALLERFGTASGVLDAPLTAIQEVPGMGPRVAQRLVRARLEQDAATAIQECKNRGVSLVPADDPGFPAALDQIPDPPPLLYVRGAFADVDALSLAIVGSRRSTPYGLRMAERLAAGLARVGMTVVSGLARGIDAAAHRGALKAGGRTIAVLANGLDSVYPPEHEELASEIAGQGALVSEMPLGQPPRAPLFPQRNRLIAGLCLGVVVVEATPRSGSLSTARHAMEQNREVFAVPGPADSLASRGCHRLLRDGATLVETVDDILDQLGPLVREVRPGGDAVPVRHPGELTLSDRERAALGQLSDTPQVLDDLIAVTGLPAPQLIATLAVLEMRRLVRRLPGNRFIRS